MDKEQLSNMDKRAAIDIIARFQKGIESRGIRPLKIILYGSYAAGHEPGRK